MSKKRKRISLAVWLALILASLAGVVLTGSSAQNESIQEIMRDAVLHESNKLDLFGMEVNPGLISAFTVTGLLLLAALLIRIFVIPKFKYVPGKFQLLLEQLVGFFNGLGIFQQSAPPQLLECVHLRSGRLYLFRHAVRAVWSAGSHDPRTFDFAAAPLSDINAAIALGCLSYLVILSGGIVANGLRGVGKTLKDFSLPISMSFRLFGALLSGLLVTELVYYYSSLSYVLPVVVAVLFTLLHALIQTYVLTMLTSLFYGEVSEVHTPKSQKNKPQTQEQH